MGTDRLPTAVPCKGTNRDGSPCKQRTRNPSQWCGLCKNPADTEQLVAGHSDLLSLAQAMPSTTPEDTVADNTTAEPSAAVIKDEEELWADLVGRCKTEQEAALLIALKQNDLVPVLYGYPGIGKTETIKRIAGQLDCELVTVITSQKDPTDIAGQPYVVGLDDGDPRLTHLLPEWAEQVFKNAQNGRRTIIFFDEIDKAPLANQNATLTILRERMIEGRYFPDGTMLVGAGNPPESGGYEFSDAMANRLAHLDWQLDRPRTIQGLSTGSWDGEDPDQGISDTLRSARIKYRSLLAGFLNSKPDALYKRPKDDSDAGRAWPSPRTWEGAVKAAAAAEALGASKSTVARVIDSAVGEGTGREFYTYAVNQDLPDPEAVLQDPDKYVKETRIDKLFTTVAAVSNTVASKPTPQRVHQALKFLDTLCANGKSDAVVQASRGLWSAQVKAIIDQHDEYSNLENLAKATKDAHLMVYSKK